MTLAEHQITKPNGHADVWEDVWENVRDSFATMRGSANEAFEKFARSPKVTLPIGKKKIELVTDRVRAAPALTPTLSGMIGMTAIGLGFVGVLFPRALARGLGLNAPTPLVQGVFGLRELWSGYSLAGDPTRADVLWARVGGDVFDVAALRTLDHPGNARRGNVRLALGLVLAVAALDVVTAVRMSTVQRNCG